MAESLWVLGRVGCFYTFDFKDGEGRKGWISLTGLRPGSAKQIARAAAAFVCQRVGSVPGSVDVARNGDSLTIKLHQMTSPAEGQPLAGAILHLHERYRSIFADSSGWLRQEIGRITGLNVHSVTTAIEATTGALLVLMAGDMHHKSAWPREMLGRDGGHGNHEA